MQQWQNQWPPGKSDTVSCKTSTIVTSNYCASRRTTSSHRPNSSSTTPRTSSTTCAAPPRTTTTTVARMADELAALRDVSLQQRRERNDVEMRCKSLEQELKYVADGAGGQEGGVWSAGEEQGEGEAAGGRDQGGHEAREGRAWTRSWRPSRTRTSARQAEIKQLTHQLAQQTDTSATLTEQLRADRTEERDVQLKGRDDDREAFSTQKELLNNQVLSLQSELAATTQKLTQQLSDTNAAKAVLQQRYEETSAEFDSFKQYAGVSDTDQLQRLVRLSVEAETMRKQLADKGELSVRLMETQKKLDEATKRAVRRREEAP